MGEWEKRCLKLGEATNHPVKLRDPDSYRDRVLRGKRNPGDIVIFTSCHIYRINRELYSQLPIASATISVFSKWLKQSAV